MADPLGRATCSGGEFWHGAAWPKGSLSFGDSVSCKEQAENGMKGLPIGISHFLQEEIIVIVATHQAVTFLIDNETRIRC